MIDEHEGFNLVYAKKGGIPKKCFFETRIEVTEFLANNLNEIDFIAINDVIIDKNVLINNNSLLSKYINLTKDV